MLQQALQPVKVPPVQRISPGSLTFREGTDLSNSLPPMGILQLHAQPLIVPLFPVTLPASEGERPPAQAPMIRLDLLPTLKRRDSFSQVRHTRKRASVGVFGILDTFRSSCRPLLRQSVRDTALKDGGRLPGGYVITQRVTANPPSASPQENNTPFTIWKRKARNLLWLMRLGWLW